MAKETNPLFFTNYSKITDTIMWLDSKVALRFSVQLSRKHPDSGRIIPFHGEAKYFNNNLGTTTYNIRRNFSVALIFDHMENYDNSIFMRMGDVAVLQYLFQNKILGWYMGDTRLYDFEDNKLVLHKTDRVQVPMTELKFIEFTPIIVEFTDGSLKEGIRMYMNSYEVFVDMSLDRFMELYYYIMQTDFHNAALNMLNYVKTQTEPVNLYDMTEKKESFFDKG